MHSKRYFIQKNKECNAMQFLVIVTSLFAPFLAVKSDSSIYGSWEPVIPRSDGGAVGQSLGMQTVHSVLLPSGKVLMTSGSSWRNLGPVEFYPDFPNPKAGRGIWNKDQDPFHNSKLDEYYQLVNNAGVYDPKENTFYRISHPTPVDDPLVKDHFAPNDLFCTGHQHLPDGNILFAGGTQYYYPYRTGHRATYIFDWKKELNITWSTVDWRLIPEPLAENPWIFSGFMERGRWYTSLVPLLDGRLALFGGYVGFDVGYPEMYQFETNSLVEFFDPSLFETNNTQAAWTAVDVKASPNGPFTSLINQPFQPTPGVNCDDRCKLDNQYDVFKLYPENYLLDDGRIFMTREGDWVSMRTSDTAHMRRTNRTYFVTIKETKITFKPGPSRLDEATSYGTSFLDPNSQSIMILGGQPTSSGTFLYQQKENYYAGGRGSRKLEQFHLSSEHWTIDRNFLDEDRTMHSALILPTRQVLIINGANYDFYGPIFYPILLTPRYNDQNAFIGYRKQRMNVGVQPRLYHNTAILLPDGRIWISGGNSARATVRNTIIPQQQTNITQQPKPNLDSVDLDMYFIDDGPLGRHQKGMLGVPTEIWAAEIFSPPYLFIDGNRRASIRDIQLLTPPKAYNYKSVIHEKTYYLLKSNKNYNIILDGLPMRCGKSIASLVMIKLPSNTHGWDGGQKFVELPYTVVPSNAINNGTGQIHLRTPNAQTANIPPAFYMLFYVDCKGKPSEAQMVRFDDRAQEL
ncbi:unnamed protein product [Didymodactylos carnosus]|uniref:Galactose oxidase n=1 Tax=Didymodactylos carnosus TaxID=1234261 RepID=A0A814ZLG5_9BILA|nr:unnamed protein product [Didymodactylos carnosus]CAF1266792.1 unnamed protein product [Didymodactylos carnosus]CAF4010835.1 unnamed protein product [Didymodactylos carnosus]CAF4072815.1 unnamed protein product [Didymodactylos carnosus]